MQRSAGGEIDWFNLRTNLVTAAFASYLHFNSTLSSREVDFQALVDLFATSSIPRGNLEDCFQQRVLFAFTEEKMIACSLTVAFILLLSLTSAAGEVNVKRMENR